MYTWEKKKKLVTKITNLNSPEDLKKKEKTNKNGIIIMNDRDLKKQNKRECLRVKWGEICCNFWALNWKK